MIGAWDEKIAKKRKKVLTTEKRGGNILLAPSGSAMNRHQADARVVELVDSLASGASAHYGRAGSTPASCTKDGHTTVCPSFFVPKGKGLSPDPYITVSAGDLCHRQFCAKKNANRKKKRLT